MTEPKMVRTTELLHSLLDAIQDAQARVSALEEKIEVLTDIGVQQQHHIDALISDLRTMEERLDTLARFNNARIPSTFWMWFSKWAGLR